MNLSTADLILDERARDRDRTFEANRLAALARVPRTRASAPDPRERLGRAAGWFRTMRRGTAV